MFLHTDGILDMFSQTGVLVNMFSNTVDIILITPAHVETVVLMGNKNSRKKDYVEIGLDADDYYKIKEGK